MRAPPNRTGMAAPGTHAPLGMSSEGTDGALANDTGPVRAGNAAPEPFLPAGDAFGGQTIVR